MRARRRGRLLVASLLGSLSLAGTNAVPAGAASAPCAPYMFIGVRGSGDPQDTMGSQVGPEWGALNADLLASGIGVGAHATVNDVALHYPAVPVVHDYYIGGHKITGPDFQATAYAGSVLAGTVAIVHEANRCRSSKLILAGHSQGANAIMLAVPLLDHRRVIAVTLFGDPLFHGSSYAGRGSFDASRNGLAAGARLPLIPGIPGLSAIGLTAGILDGISRNAYPGDLSGRLYDYCNAGDGVCQGLFHCSFSTGCKFNGFASHSLYATNGDTTEGAAIIAHLIRDDLGAQGHPVPEPAPVSKGPVDVAFAIDSTGSMEPIIDSVRSDIQALVAQIVAVEPDYRLGLVTYRDALPYCEDAYQAITVHDFTSDTTAFSSALNSINAEGGCDEPESVFTGAMQGLSLAYRPNATKVEVMVGDAPGHDPDPATGYSASDVIARAQAESVAIYGIDARTAGSTYSQLTQPTGGKLVSISDASQVPTAIQQAISAQATAPSASASIARTRSRTSSAPGAARAVAADTSTGYAGVVGVPVAFSAAASWSPLGRPLSYQWDFNSDGVPDVQTEAPVALYTWAAPFTGEATLTVKDSAGQTAVTRVPVTIAANTLQVPGKPSRPRLKRTRGGIRINWSTSTRGGAPAAYVVRSSSGAILAYLLPSSGRRQTAVLRTHDRHRMRINLSGVNAEGESAASQPSNPS
jgi:Cutinase/von Willebrand factor type A domain/PKD domain